MAPNIEVSIPTTTISHTPNPYTIYEISVRLPLHPFTIPKRYSDFSTLHSALSKQVDQPPPLPLPSKSWFANTVSNAAFREDRRKGLEKYIQAINNSEDSRWRDSSAWRTFLNLPANTTTSNASRPHSAMIGPGAAGAPITDPTIWLDCHRAVKAHLHDARLHLTRRDQASSPHQQHECSTSAKSCLVRAGTMLGPLEEGLKNISDRSAWDGPRLREGELRRRKDLLTSVRKERDGLEDLLNAMTTKSKLDSAVASMQDKHALIGNRNNKATAGPGRVLGKETDRTRELDNVGVLQLQQQVMRDQDVGVEELRKIVARQKELGMAINNELDIQVQMLNMVEEDTDRLAGKIKVAKGRTDRIS
ncbi:hypothetical protein FQN57_001737 [Myotisia sp. PD_48]|nr:hypothetical protein FQN57_001737 [Myotisia sp. PD_48]